MIIKNDKNIKVLTPDGFKYFSHIRKQTKKSMRMSFYENVDYIDVTYDHIFIKNNKEIYAKDIKENDKLEHYKIKAVKVKKIEDIGIIDVYDLMDVDGHIYYTNDLKSHNCKFLGSSNTVINAATLKILLTQWIEPDHYDLNDKLKIFESPQKGEVYITGIDIAKGTGEHYSVIQVMKVVSYDPFKLEQVAVFHDNHIDVYSFSEVVHRISIYYNKAYAVVENNAEGSTVVSKLWWDFEYENLVNESSKSTGLGVRATKKTKPKAVLLMKKLIEDGDLILYDKETINELSTFVESGSSFKGKDGLDDDLVSALYWACYITEFDIFDKDICINTNIDDDGWGILSDVDTSIEEWYQ